MTKISEYPIISNPTEDDILIGTDVNSSDVTKNFSIGSIVNLVQNGGRPYKSYTALLTQEGEDAPVATILENTLGDIVWTYDAPGSYFATLTGGFIIDKTWMVADTLQNTGAYTQNYKTLNVIELYTFNNSNVMTNSYLNNTGIEIRVYN